MNRSKEDKRLDLIELVLALVALTAVVGAAMATLSGCIIQSGEGEWRELIAPHLAALSNKLDQASAAHESPAAQEEAVEIKAPPSETDANYSASYQQVTQVADEMDFAQLQFCYGGFSGKNAAPVSGCVIGSLKVSSSGMSYKWQAGGCEMLGAADRGDANCIAALFVKGADGKWRGGKFDWISTSRTSRSFENIHGEYNGWPSDAIEKAQGYAFVITSKDGKKRTNVIVSSK